MLEIRTLYNYIGMAEGNYREYLKNNFVRAKKYFYVLRPILACQWILDRRTLLQVLFSELMEAELPAELIGAANQLLELKVKCLEVKLIPRISEINEYLDESILSIKSAVRLLDDNCSPNWNELNRLFLKNLMDWEQYYINRKKQIILIILGGITMGDWMDLDGDGEVDRTERRFANEMLNDQVDEYEDEDDLELELLAAGLDIDELEFMDPDERAELLEAAGLDPDDYDFD